MNDRQFFVRAGIIHIHVYSLFCRPPVVAGYFWFGYSRWKRGRLSYSERLGSIDKPATGCFNVPPNLFDEDELSAAGFGCNPGRARAGKRIEHDFSRARIRFNDGLDGNHWLLIGVILVARIFPGKEIRQGMVGLGRSSLGKKKPHLVITPSVAFPRTMCLYPDEVAHWPKPAFSPGRHEQIDPRPAIEGGEKSIRFKNPVEFPKSRSKPGCTVVVMTPPAVPGNVIHQVGWVGDDEIDAFAGQVCKDTQAVSVDDAI